MARKTSATFVVNIMDTFGLDLTDRNQFISSLVRFDEQGFAAYVQYVDELMATEFYDPSADAVTSLRPSMPLKAWNLLTYFLSRLKKAFCRTKMPTSTKSDGFFTSLSAVRKNNSISSTSVPALASLPNSHASFGTSTR